MKIKAFISKLLAHLIGVVLAVALASAVLCGATYMKDSVVGVEYE